MMDLDSAMLRALELAENGTGYVSPNPRVGAVILDNSGEIIGEGWHKQFGGPHAEVEAISNSGRDTFEGCTIVVTLEPCSHHGKTPPCSDLIIEKKFSRVVIGSLDRNPLVRGNGVKKLLDARIEVIQAVQEAKCDYLNRAFFKYITTGLPYVAIKAAQSFDGKIALQNGESKWITSPASRMKVQHLRAEFDSIIAGRQTLLKDNPALDVREIEKPSPKRILLDADLTLPLHLKVFEKANEVQTILFHDSDDESKIRKYSETGANLERINRNRSGYLDLHELLKMLGTKYHITSLLVEGGAQLYSEFLKERLVDEFHFFVAPKIIGKGIETFGSLEFEKLADAFELEVINSEKFGEDFYFAGKVNYH
jgi:diaminohydroxyphosphoribosylaminopyrimidine deaminase/5-amino-6-(5-phosphoribosylamino)uracil reductase